MSTVRVRKIKAAPKGPKLSKRQAREVKKIVGRVTEEKTFFPSSIAQSVPAGGAGGLLIKLTGVAQNIGGNQRIGDHIMFKQLHVRLNVAVSLSGDVTNFIRLIFFQWTPNDASTPPTVGDILQDPVLGWYSHYNDTNMDGGRYRIMLDRTLYVNDTTLRYQNRSYRMFGKRIPRKQLTFNPGGAITGMNHIYCLAVSDSLASPHPILQLYSKLVYSDA